LVPLPPRRAALRVLAGLPDPRCKFDLWDWRDPRPALLEWPRILRQAVAQTAPGTRRDASRDAFGRPVNVGGRAERRAALLREVLFVLRVLTYHRIAEPEADRWLHPRLVSATPDVFARHLAYVAQHYRVVSLQAVQEAATGGTALPRRAVLLTFDDAYRDFLDHSLAALAPARAAGGALRADGIPGRSGNAPSGGIVSIAAACRHRVRACGTRTPRGAAVRQRRGGRRTSLARLQRDIKSQPHDVAMAAVDALGAALGEPSGAPRAVLTWDELRSWRARGSRSAAHTRDHPHH
jgi:hypothetical protein